MLLPDPGNDLLGPEGTQQLETVVKHWLRKLDRSPLDLARALGVPSTQMAELMAELQRTHRRNGLPGLVERLCLIEEQWLSNGDFEPDQAVVEAQLDLLLESLQGDS